MSLQTKTPGAGKQPGANFKHSKWRKFTATQFARGIACGLLVSASAFFTGVSLARCTYRAMHGTITPALKSAGAENTQQLEAATPTVKRGFVMSESFAGAGVSSASRHDYGRDEPIRKDGCTTSCVFSHPAHPMPLKTATGGPQSQLGA